MKPAFVLAGATLLCGLLWWFSQPPSADNIISNMQFEKTEIKYKGKKYAAEWQEEEISFSGDARVVLAEYNDFVPFNTHIVVVTNGAYSDPEIVGVKDGKIFIQPDADFKKDNSGDINTLHLVPRDQKIYKQIKALKSDQKITIYGHIESDGRVTDENGRYIQFGNLQKGRILLLATKLEIH